ncbi:g5409 [Coccomyxa viridis]|uniref:G5409 protein n=1 Tax=Coccomyxa viridis TaxID=1274662 RepID=A0ABP1FSR5_9CHLO
MMCRRATSSGYEYFSSACAGFDYQGLNARQYGTYRKTTVDKILELAMERGVVMLEGPRLSGKTSLVQLLGRKADESKQFSRVISLSPMNGRDFQHQLSRFWDATWKELISSTPEGGSVEALSYCLPEEWDQKCTIMLDPRPDMDVGIRLSLLEYQELLSSFRLLKWKDAVSSGELSKVIYDVTAGQAGLITAILDKIDGKLEEEFGLGVFDNMLR